MRDKVPILSFDDAVRIISSQSKARLIAIDGLPVAGKSTLAERLAHVLGARCIYLDDFVKPEVDWPSGAGPSFPFDFIRYQEFLDAVTALGRDGSCSYSPFDWERGCISPQRRTVGVGPPVIVEGVSALHPELAPLYDLRIWVESDPSSTLQASLDRGVAGWAREWEMKFLPSVDLYLSTKPRSRADMLVAGRGVLPHQ